jgi:hypothetical protein
MIHISLLIMISTTRNILASKNQIIHAFHSINFELHTLICSDNEISE